DEQADLPLRLRFGRDGRGAECRRRESGGETQSQGPARGGRDTQEVAAVRRHDAPVGTRDRGGGGDNGWRAAARQCRRRVPGGTGLELEYPWTASPEVSGPRWPGIPPRARACPRRGRAGPAPARSAAARP